MTTKTANKKSITLKTGTVVSLKKYSGSSDEKRILEAKFVSQSGADVSCVLHCFYDGINHPDICTISVSHDLEESEIFGNNTECILKIGKHLEAETIIKTMQDLVALADKNPEIFSSHKLARLWGR